MYLPVFVSLEQLRIVTSIVITKPSLSSFLHTAIVIMNFVRRFQSNIADTMGWWKNIMLA